jgi:hypothetical protein
MKSIHYDAEGDILSVTFVEAEGQKHTGVETPGVTPRASRLHEVFVPTMLQTIAAA